MKKLIVLALLAATMIACTTDPGARRDRSDRMLERRSVPARGM
jgi:hypothetical protein